MSVVSHAGPVFNLARRRLKKPRTPGLSASFVHGRWNKGAAPALSASWIMSPDGTEYDAAVPPTKLPKSSRLPKPLARPKDGRNFHPPSSAAAGAAVG